MLSTIPKSQIILGYRDLFHEEPPADRLALLSGMDKDTVIGEIARLNYALKPNDQMHPDVSFETQVKELWYMCGQIPALHNKYVDLLKPFRATPDNYPLLFTRQACLFATEEIIQSDLKKVEGFTMEYSWERLLKYYLAVSSVITDVRSKEKKKMMQTINNPLIQLST